MSTQLTHLPALSELRELGYSAEAMVEYPGYFAAAGKAERLVLTGKKYSSHKARTWLAQGKRCARCPRPIGDPREAHFHHIHGRGMGGGKRDDRDAEALCHGCHNRARIQRRASWISKGLFLVPKGGAA